MSYENRTELTITWNYGNCSARSMLIIWRWNCDNEVNIMKATNYTNPDGCLAFSKILYSYEFTEGKEHKNYIGYSAGQMKWKDLQRFKYKLKSNK